MPAIPADIAAATRDAVNLTWDNPGVAARYPSARDGSVTPAEGFFDNAADAQAVVNARGLLIGVERRRFAPTSADLLWPDLSAGLPARRLIDTEQAVDAAMLVARIEIDLEAETTADELFG